MDSFKSIPKYPEGGPVTGGGNHTHPNKSVIDSITQTNVNNFHTKHSNRANLDSINQNLSKASDANFKTVTATGNITAYSSGNGAPQAAGVYTVTQLNIDDNLAFTGYGNLLDADGTINDSFIQGGTATSVDWDDITSNPFSGYQPGAFASAGHNHDTIYSKLGHTHSWSDLTSAISETASLINITKPVTIGGDLNVSGNIIQQGDTYITHAEHVRSEDDFITMRYNAVSGLGASEVSGFEILDADGVNTVIFGSDNSAIGRVGWQGDTLQAIATREDAPTLNGIPYFDSEDKFATSANATLDALGNLTATTLDTGQGANELYPMDQDVRSTAIVEHQSVQIPRTERFYFLETAGGDERAYIRSTQGATTNDSSTDFNSIVMGVGAGQEIFKASVLNTGYIYNRKLGINTEETEGYTLNVNGTANFKDTLTGVDASFSSFVKANGNITAYADGSGAPESNGTYSVTQLNASGNVAIGGTNLIASDGYIDDSLLPDFSVGSVAWGDIDNNPFANSTPSNFATSTHNHDGRYLQSVPSGYATESWVEGKGYLTSLPSHDHDTLYYRKSEVVPASGGTFTGAIVATSAWVQDGGNYTSFGVRRGGQGDGNDVYQIGFDNVGPRGRVLWRDLTNGANMVEVSYKTNGDMELVTGTHFAADHKYGSDRRLKSNITDLEALDIASHANLKLYNKEGLEEKQIGLIAQDLEQANKHLVSWTSHKEYGKIRTLSAGSIASVALAGVKEVNHKTDRQTSLINQLRSRVAQLEHELNVRA